MPAGEPTLGEVARTLERFEKAANARFAELNAAISLMVTRDLYEAHRQAMERDISELWAELKGEREKRAADRRMVVGTLLTAVLAVVVGILNVALKNGIGG